MSPAHGELDQEVTFPSAAGLDANGLIAARPERKLELEDGWTRGHLCGVGVDNADVGPVRETVRCCPQRGECSIRRFVFKIPRHEQQIDIARAWHEVVQGRRAVEHHRHGRLTERWRQHPHQLFRGG